jgi:hypothetical protein
MATYTTKLKSSQSPEEAFLYLADLSNFAQWDPGVTKASHVEGTGTEKGAQFDVTVKAIGPDLTLRYTLTGYEPYKSFTAVAKSTVFTSTDTITVEPAESGCFVTYSAVLQLNGPLALGDLWLRPVFKRIGDRAAHGLRAALRGTAA